MSRLALFLIAFNLLPSLANAGDVKQMMIERINSERDKKELQPLTFNKKLEAAAQSHADWMARTGKMVHVQGEKPQGNSRETWAASTWHPINRAIKAGYLDLEILSKPNANDYVGENIAHGDENSGPNRFRPSSIVSGWMRSSGHREAMLGNYRDVGIGVMVTERGDVFWCAVFGKQ